MSIATESTETREEENYAVFRDCLSSVIIAQLAPRPNKRHRRRSSKGKRADSPEEAEEEKLNAVEELGDFIDYLAGEIFHSLSSELRTLSHAELQNDPKLQDLYSDPISQSVLDSIIATLPPSINDCISSYGLSNDTSTFLSPILSSYIAAVTEPPKITTRTTKATSCALCDRDWVPLTFHHLVPREVAAKAVKRGWVTEEAKQHGCKICRACHNFVHEMAPNEELARDWHDVDAILAREDVQKWIGWVGRVRWKAQ